MRHVFQLLLLTMAVAGFAAANDVPRVPEIGPGSAAGALTLLGGALLVLRARRKR